MTNELKTLDAATLRRFLDLQGDAVNAVTERFYATHGSAYARFGPAGRKSCREDLAFHLEFLRPVLEFGLLQPMVEYLRWLDSVLAARGVPTEHLALSLTWLAESYAGHVGAADGGANGKDAAVGAAVSAALLTVRDQFLASADAPPKPLTPPEPWPEAAPFEAALLAGKQAEALALVNACLDGGRNLVDIEMHVIQPALYHIGDKWQANAVSVAQEHMATAIVQSVMTVAMLRAPAAAPRHKRVLLACVEGNNHMVGLRMVADALQLGGWEVQYLGANVPNAALLRQALEWKPDLVGLSVSFAQQMPAAKAAIALLAEQFGSARPAVMIGGLAINRFEPLAGVAGADCSGMDANAAVASANRITAA